MPPKRFTVEQIVAKLREAERLQGQGMTVPQVSERLGVSEQALDISMLKDGSTPAWRTHIVRGRGVPSEGVRCTPSASA